MPKQLFTTVARVHDGAEMTYGLYDRFLSWALHRLNNYIENRRDKQWARGDDPGNDPRW